MNRDLSMSGDPIISSVKRAGFYSDRMPFKALKGHWCDVTVLIMHAPTKNRRHD